MIIDLNPYGLRWTIDTSKPIEHVVTGDSNATPGPGFDKVDAFLAEEFDLPNREKKVAYAHSSKVIEGSYPPSAPSGFKYKYAIRLGAHIDSREWLLLPDYLIPVKVRLDHEEKDIDAFVRSSGTIIQSTKPEDEPGYVYKIGTSKGIRQWVLIAKPDTFYIPIDLTDKIFIYKNSNEVVIKEQTIYFNTSDEPFIKGFYGSLYKCNGKINDKDVVMKRIEIPDDKDIRPMLKEFIVQLFVEKITGHINETFVKGPFCPHCFYFMMDDKHCYMFTESIKMELWDILQKPDLTDALTKNYIIQISRILIILKEKCHFNHRDLKTTNIMIDSDNHIRLIDFGLSCLKYGTLKISIDPDDRFNPEKCDEIDRDISSLLLDISLTMKPFTAKHKNLADCLKYMLEWKYDKNIPTTWDKSYKHFNKTSYFNPFTEPSFVYKVLSDPKFDYTTEFIYSAFVKNQSNKGGGKRTRRNSRYRQKKVKKSRKYVYLH